MPVRRVTVVVWCHLVLRCTYTTRGVTMQLFTLLALLFVATVRGVLFIAAGLVYAAWCLLWALAILVRDAALEVRDAARRR